jgi:hypothetical protein
MNITRPFLLNTATSTIAYRHYSSNIMKKNGFYLNRNELISTVKNSIVPTINDYTTPKQRAFQKKLTNIIPHPLLNDYSRLLITGAHFKDMEQNNPKLCINKLQVIKDYLEVTKLLDDIIETSHQLRYRPGYGNDFVECLIELTLKQERNQTKHIDFHSDHEQYLNMFTEIITRALSLAPSACDQTKQLFLDANVQFFTNTLMEIDYYQDINFQQVITMSGYIKLREDTIGLVPILTLTDMLKEQTPPTLLPTHKIQKITMAQKWVTGNILYLNDAISCFKELDEQRLTENETALLNTATIAIKNGLVRTPKEAINMCIQDAQFQLNTGQNVHKIILNEINSASYMDLDTKKLIQEHLQLRFDWVVANQLLSKYSRIYDPHESFNFSRHFSLSHPINP